MRILFIQTGGSIDKDYPRVVKGYGFEIGEPAVERILGRVSLNFEYEILSVLRKDSLDITDEDREKIYDVCVKADSGKIIVTHGTDTMIETAKKLSSIKDKVIVLTGAMRPERFRDSDADFNLGTAIGGINVLENGVYIVMNGRICLWDKVKRDLETGQFVEK